MTTKREESNRMIDMFKAKQLDSILYNLKIPSPTGLPQWSKRTIEKMLKNEKYVGNVILLKTINEINNKGFIENILVKQKTIKANISFSGLSFYYL